MQSGTKTELSQANPDNYINNSQIHELELSSKISSNQRPHVRSRKALDIHSEAPKKDRSLASVDYKLELLKLMVVVKLESYGYRQSDINGLIDFEMAAIEDIEGIESRDIDLRATETSLRVMSTLLGQPNPRVIPRFHAQSSRSQSRVGPLEMNLQAIPVERMDEMQVVEMRRELPEILCNICYTPSSHYCQEECGHAFCVECMKGYLRENLRSGNYIIKCPEYECPDHLTINIVKMVLRGKELERFLYFRDKNEKEMNPDNKFCSKPDCGELLDKTSDRLICRKCDSTYCQICLQVYHNDNPCDIVLRNSLENTYKSFQIKKCPSCKSPIEKSEGCNHMTCKKCKFQFCWLCLKKYSRHHYKYYNCLGCPGMQFEEEEEVITERLKQLLFYFLVPFVIALVLFCYLAAVPLYMIGCFIYKPCSWADIDKEFIQSAIVRNICCCLGQCGSRLLLWLLYQPRAALYAAFVAPMKLTIMFCGEVCKVFQ